MVTLWEYRRAADGRNIYSTDLNAPAGFEPAGKPLCRVWKTPGHALTLDWRAKPVAALEP